KVRAVCRRWSSGPRSSHSCQRAERLRARAGASRPPPCRAQNQADPARARPGSRRENHPRPSAARPLRARAIAKPARAGAAAPECHARADRRSAAPRARAARIRQRHAEIHGFRSARRFPRRRAPCCVRRCAKPGHRRRGSRRVPAARRARRAKRPRFFALRAAWRRAISRRSMLQAWHTINHPVSRLRFESPFTPQEPKQEEAMSAVPQQPAANDPDSLETQEWLDALESVLEREGGERAHYLIEKLTEKARTSGVTLPYSPYTPYVNTIPAHMEERSPGNYDLEERIRSYCRWNAMVMVARANKNDDELGGHIASFASVGTLFGTGQHHFWNAPHEGHGGDLVYFQGHSSPGIYARGLLEGRFTEDQMLNFRREVDGKGISSYPHPWLMPDYWQFPTVSMGLGPIQAIYMARYLKYLHARGHANTENRKVWCFCGDGEMDEPESLGAIGMAARESLDNLIFVINCNLQRLDGPVRGNGKIIQELEADFRGAGWNVIKVIWGSRWDPLLARDKQGILMRRMMECVDGEYQTFKSKDGAYVREYFFNTPELKELVADWSDEEIWHLNRGGHDPHKIYAAYHAAVNHKGQPTVILAKTIKGYGMGESGEAQ